MKRIKILCAALLASGAALVGCAPATTTSAALPSIELSGAETMPIAVNSPPASHQLTSYHSQEKQVRSILTLSRRDNLFELVRNAPGVVLIDFYADWCGPCKTQGGILADMQQLAARHQASIIKVNIDQHPELASQFEVSSLPTLMLVSEGRIIDRRSGVADHQQVAEMLAR